MPSSKTASTCTCVTMSTTPGKHVVGAEDRAPTSTASTMGAAVARGLGHGVGDDRGGLGHVEPQPPVASRAGEAGREVQQQPIDFRRGFTAVRIRCWAPAGGGPTRRRQERSPRARPHADLAGSAPVAASGIMELQAAVPTTDEPSR